MILSFVLVPLCFYFVHELKSSPLTMGGVSQRNMHTSCLFLMSSETLNGNSVHIIVSRSITKFIPNPAHLYIKLQTQNKKNPMCIHLHTQCVHVLTKPKHQWVRTIGYPLWESLCLYELYPTMQLIWFCPHQFSHTQTTPTYVCQQ